MATVIKKCKVCGKEYEYCHTVRRFPNIFRWQDVSCSPTCGNIYLAKIRESRANDDGKDRAVLEDTEPVEASATTPECLSNYEDEDDDEFEKDFDDELE